MGHERRYGIPLKNGLEQDALTGWRRHLNWRPGARRFAKTLYNRRVRRRPIDPVEFERDPEAETR